jgi:trehalose 6-phosphate synthase/phosphatase
MNRYLDSYNATDWANSFMKSLSKGDVERIADDTINLSTTSGEAHGWAEIVEAIGDRELVICLDYDGTTVPIYPRPELAILDEETAKWLKELSRIPQVHLVVISGRDGKFLETQLQGIPVAMAAEHGAQFRPPNGGRWKRLVHRQQQVWFDSVKRIMSDYSARVPDSFIEKKQYGLSWHYRESPVDFGAYQAQKLKRDLENALVNLPVSVLEGSKVIEVRSSEANKGRFVEWYISRFHESTNPVVIALGDDRTDEDMFAAVNSSGLGVKVGMEATHARYRIETQAEVLPLLERISELRRTQLSFPGFPEGGGSEQE